MIDPKMEIKVSPGQVPFDRAEYEARWIAVRKRMGDEGLDAVLVTAPENVFYLTGYQTFGNAQQFLVLGAEDDHDPIFVLRQLESPLVEYTTWVREVRPYQDHEDPVATVARVIAELTKGAGARLGIDEGTPSLPIGLYKRIVEAGGLEPAPASVVEEVRKVKTASEIALCRAAASLTDVGMRAALDTVAEGRDENTVAAAAAAAMIRKGSEWFGEQPIVTAGERSGIPHTTFARRPLRRGESVLIEMSAAYHRHFSPLMRTAFIGHPPEHVERMHDACRLALEATLSAIRPGITSGQAHDVCAQVIAEAGFPEWFRKRLGYSVGVGFNTWNEGHIIDLKANDGRVLEAGMVFHMPPALRDPNRYGVGLSETIVITDDGCEVLGTIPRDMHIV